MSVPEGPDPMAGVPTYLTGLRVAHGEIGMLAYWHTVLHRLAENAEGMSAGALREEIRRVADAVRDRESVRRAGEVTS